MYRVTGPRCPLLPFQMILSKSLNVSCINSWDGVNCNLLIFCCKPSWLNSMKLFFVHSSVQSSEAFLLICMSFLSQSAQGLQCLELSKTLWQASQPIIAVEIQGLQCLQLSKTLWPELVVM